LNIISKYKKKGNDGAGRVGLGWGMATDAGDCAGMIDLTAPLACQLVDGGPTDAGMLQPR
jgi:hypothetical protein